MGSKDKFCILAFSGSLRMCSYNTGILRAAQKIAPPEIEIKIFDRIGEFPLFNPDLGDGDSIEVVHDFREAIKMSAALLITSPEYVHGVPGVLKNALDWVVGTGELDQKPVGLINVSPALNGANWVRDSLTEILNVMSANHVLSDASFVVPGAALKFDEQGDLKDEETFRRLEVALKALAKRSSPLYNPGT